MAVGWSLLNMRPVFGTPFVLDAEDFNRAVNSGFPDRSRAVECTILAVGTTSNE